MKKLNVILVYDLDETKILMCKRTKEPFKGKFNLVGGKLEPNEEDLTGAYRELKEETGITDKDIKLIHLMDFRYTIQDMELQVYVGKLNKEVILVKEINELYWIDKNDNFFNGNKYAGGGNIGIMLNEADKYKDRIF